MSGAGDPTPRMEDRAHALSRSLRVPVTVLEWSGKLIAAVTLVSMFGALFVNVVLRYAVGSGIPWAYEIHAVLLPWLVAGGIVIAAARGQNISISLLPDMTGPQARRIILVMVNLIILVIAVSVLWSSQPILRASQFQRLSTLGIKQVWGYSSLVYAFAAMAVIAALDVAQGLIGPAPEAQDPTKSSLS